MHLRLGKGLTRPGMPRSLWIRSIPTLINPADSSTLRRCVRWRNRSGRSAFWKTLSCGRRGSVIRLFWESAAGVPAGWQERLRGQLDSAQNLPYESKVVRVGEVAEYLNCGYDLMAAVDADHIILRRRA